MGRRLLRETQAIQYRRAIQEDPLISTQDDTHPSLRKQREVKIAKGKMLTAKGTKSGEEEREGVREKRGEEKRGGA
jgi:hypothetical protein